MRRSVLSRLRAWVTLLPALARVGLRRARGTLRRSGDRGHVTVERSTDAGVVSLSLGLSAPVLVDDSVVGTVTSVIEPGTSTAETSSELPADPALVATVVDLVVEAVTTSADVRRIAWYVPTSDAALSTAVTSAGFACEGWAAPPVGDARPHQLWSLLTGLT